VRGEEWPYKSAGARDDERVSAVVRALTDDQPPGAGRLVTLTGLPGVGRSTLATAVADRFAAKGFATLVVPLSGVEDPLGVIDAIVDRLRDRVGLSTSAPEAFWEAYDGADLLLVLEDVDEVQGLGEVLSGLHEGYPAALVLATAHRPTRVTGERVVRLAPLPLPGDDAPADHPALLLFAERAALAGSPVDLEDARIRADVARICRLTGALPGAIALAAARVGTMPPALLARALAGQHGLATLDAGSDPAGTALETSLAWSIELLSKAARDTLVQVSVFEGPFLLDAVAAVVAVDPESGDPTDDLLELVAAHLVDLDPDGTGEPRFVVPGFLRALLRRRLEADHRLNEVKDRHARYFTDRGRAGVEVVRREWPDIAAALDHNLGNGRFDDALVTAVALAPELQEVPGAAASLEDTINELLAVDGHVPPRLRAQALMWSTRTFPDGVAADMQRFGLWTARRLAEATSLAREAGDGPALLAALERTIFSLRITLDLATAVAAAHEGLELARRLDDQPALARFECWVSMVLRSSGDAEHARRLAISSLERGRAHGDPVASTAAAQQLLALPPELRPVLEPPLPTLEELLEECERLDQPFTGMTVLGVLGFQSRIAGRPQDAARWLWRLLMIGANRQRTEPMATLGGVALLLSVALTLGDVDAAALLRECTRPLELFMPYSIGPEALPDYLHDVGLLDATVAADEQARLAAEVATLGMAGINRRAQEIARRLSRHRPPDRVVPPSRAPTLTPREREVLGAMASGRTNREIADLLGMSTKTVMHHTVAIYRKLGVRGRAGATAWAYQHDPAAGGHESR
jgi:predicted ATPase/DNA-binding CsgD family transcriptional regulator